jgi:tRNA pseudouridine55 synthase
MGERAYALARAGEALDLAARDLWVESLEMIERPDADTVILRWCVARAAMSARSRVIWGRRLGALGMCCGCAANGRGRSMRHRMALSLEKIDALARTEALDALVLPLEVGLADLPELKATAEGAARLKNGNPGMVIASDVEYGDEAWASYQGRPVAVGIYKSGELHPSRVFNL